MNTSSEDLSVSEDASIIILKIHMKRCAQVIVLEDGEESLSMLDPEDLEKRRHTRNHHF